MQPTVGARVAPSVTARIRAAPPPPLLRSRGGQKYVAALAALTLGGCVTLLPKATPVQLYRFGPQPAAAASPPSLRPGGPVRGVLLAEVELPRSAAGDGLLTVDGDKVAYVDGARWVEPAAVLLRADVQAAFAARGNDLLLLDPGQSASAAAVLRLRVANLETRYGGGAAGAAPVVVVRLRASLERPDGSAILVRDFDAEQPAAADRVSAIVAAYDAAVGTVLAQLVDWTDTAVLQPQTPPVGEPAR